MKINIVFGSSIYVTMKESKILNNIIEFDTIFSVADLSNINNFKITIPKEICNYNKYSFKEKIDKLQQLINSDNVDIRIWTSHYEINSYLLFLYLCNYLENIKTNIFVVFSDEYDKEYYSPASMNIEELEALTNLEHKLTKEEVCKYSLEWKKIENTNCDLRILEDKKIKLVSYDYLNEKILNKLKQLGKTRVSILTGNIMSKYYLPDIIIVYLIKRLINNKKIKIIKESKERFFESTIMIY